MSSNSSRRGRDTLTTLLHILLAILLADQLRFLFSYPVPDTGMWFGDESWTMLTVRALAQSGIARVPEAIGSSLSHSNGLINGSIWIAGVLYGVPTLIFSNLGSPVGIGRLITFVLSLISLSFIYRLARSAGASAPAALIGVFSIVISNVFYFSSHSARLDMVTGLAVLLYFLLLLKIFDRIQAGDSLGAWAFILPCIALLSIAVYVHVPTLIAIPTLFSMWRFGIFRSLRTVLIALAGATSAIMIVVGIYWLTTGSLDLLGRGYNQYYNVANSLPVLHLLSWRVQKINTIDRAIQVWEVARPVVVTIVLGIVLRIWRRFKLDPKERFLLINTLLLLIGWGLFGGPAVFYNIHVMPVAAVCGAILLAPALQDHALRGIRGILVPCLILAAVFAIITQETHGRVGERLVSGNDLAIRSLIAPIASQAQPPLLLCDEPAEHVIASAQGIRLMTNHLLLFGEENKPLPDILRAHRVDYLLLYTGSHWRSPFRGIADSLYTLAGERVGTFTDLGRTYDAPHWNEFDTLRLYKAK